MVLTKEYRICMPLTVEEYQIGQLYMIARHSHEQSEGGEGVEVVENTTCEDPEHGKGQYTEKRIHLSSRLPYWIQSFLPKLFYVTEKAWNYYPFTITEYTCSFVSKFCISIKTKYEDNNGCTENCLNLDPEVMSNRVVEYLDIAYDEVNPKHYKEEEDVRYFKSIKTGRGPLSEGWRDHATPIMCSYKMVTVQFDIWGVQSRAEDMIQRTIREILLLGHRQAFAWIDQWFGMSLSDVRAYEKQMQLETNTKVSSGFEMNDDGTQPTILPECIPVADGGPSSASQTPTTPNAPKTNKSWFSWS